MSVLAYFYIAIAAFFAYFAIGQIIVVAAATYLRVRNHFYIRGLFFALAVVVVVSFINLAIQAA